MKVGIDTFGCDHGRSGIGSYLLSLVPCLPVQPEVTYDLFGPEMDRYTYTGENGINFVSANVPDSLAAERFWHLFNVNSFGKKQKYDAILYPAGARMLPLSFRIPGVAVVNDIVSNLFQNADDPWLRKQIRKGLSRADCIIAASQYIRKDLERFGIKNEHVEVVHNGIDHSLFYPRTIESEETIDIKPFAIKRPYFIYASRMASEEKKHVELIKAFTLFKQKTNLPHRLVLAGSDGPYSDIVHKAAFESPAANDIFLTGYFPHESFPELYRGAEACIFPSVNEGVGLPVIEAMATGLPVACAKAGALTEIAGNNALYFNADNIDEMESVMEQIVTDKQLRAKLTAGGLEWTKRFDWEKTASLTIDVLKKYAKK
jgi:glycosyltransferase involved in cell wall biosynthesis